MSFEVLRVEWVLNQDSMTFSIQYSFDPETKQFIASIPELHLSDYGDSIDEADKNLKTMITLYFEEAQKTQQKDHAYV